MKNHHYHIEVRWTGNTGSGTSSYRAYRRDHVISAAQKPIIPGSSDPHFRGDPARYNPEEMFVASLSTCHMLWYLHLCADAGIVVTAYEDHATGLMEEGKDGGGHFREVTLHPVVTITDETKLSLAGQLHHQAHERCFIANSVNFPVLHQPTTRISRPE